MIRHLSHKDIDKAWWDAALKRSANRLWYAQSWVLDHCSPGWEALVDEDSGAIMPLTWRKKWNIDYLYQPIGLQQLGVFATAPEAVPYDAFLEAVPRRFAYWDICLQSTPAPPALADLVATERTNQVLPLHQAYGSLRASYSQGHRRNLRGEAGRFSSMPSHAFFRLFERTTGKRFGGSDARGLHGLEGAVREGVQRGQCEITAFELQQEPIGAMVVVNWEGRIILLKSANLPAGLESKAMFRLVDHHIARSAGSGALFDFAGSMDAGTARFNAGFGATPAPYFRVVRNRLPRPLRWFKT